MLALCVLPRLNEHVYQRLSSSSEEDLKNKIPPELVPSPTRHRSGSWSSCQKILRSTLPFFPHSPTTRSSTTDSSAAPASTSRPSASLPRTLGAFLGLFLVLAPFFLARLLLLLRPTHHVGATQKAGWAHRAVAHFLGWIFQDVALCGLAAAPAIAWSAQCGGLAAAPAIAWSAQCGNRREKTVRVFHGEIATTRSCNFSEEDAEQRRSVSCANCGWLRSCEHVRDNFGIFGKLVFVLGVGGLAGFEWLCLFYIYYMEVRLAPEVLAML